MGSLGKTVLGMEWYGDLSLGYRAEHNASVVLVRVATRGPGNAPQKLETIPFNTSAVSTDCSTSRAQPARGGSPQPGGPHGPKAEWHERQHIGKEGNIGTGGKGLTGGRQPPLAGSSGSSDQGRADPQRSVTAGGAEAHPPVSPSARGYPLLPSRVPRQENPPPPAAVAGS